MTIPQQAGDTGAERTWWRRTVWRWKWPLMSSWRCSLTPCCPGTTSATPPPSSSGWLSSRTPSGVSPRHRYESNTLSALPWLVTRLDCCATAACVVFFHVYLLLFFDHQDTVVALQALSLYSTRTYSPAGSVTITVTSKSGTESIQFIVDQNNRLLYQEKELKEVPSEYTVKAEGKGCVYVQVSSGQ